MHTLIETWLISFKKTLCLSKYSRCIEVWPPWMHAAVCVKNGCLSLSLSVYLLSLSPSVSALLSLFLVLPLLFLSVAAAFIFMYLFELRCPILFSFHVCKLSLPFDSRSELTTCLSGLSAQTWGGPTPYTVTKSWPIFFLEIFSQTPGILLGSIPNKGKICKSHQILIKAWWENISI